MVFRGQYVLQFLAQLFSQCFLPYLNAIYTFRIFFLVNTTLIYTHSALITVLWGVFAIFTSFYKWKGKAIILSYFSCPPFLSKDKNRGEKYSMTKMEKRDWVFIYGSLSPLASVGGLPQLSTRNPARIRLKRTSSLSLVRWPAHDIYCKTQWFCKTFLCSR